MKGFFYSGSSRILAIWDQTIQTGAAPEGFLYGSEYNREEINRALQSEDPYEIVPSRDENGHGSNLTAVAAGSIFGNGMEYMVVVCGGNEGNAAHHYQGNLNSPKSPGASREAVEVRVGPRI